MFFFKANHLSGDVSRAENIVDHKWVTFDQLPQYLDSKYFNAVKNIFALNYV